MRPSALVSPLGLTRRFLLAGNGALTGTLAGTSVGVGALSANRQCAAMPVAAIALDIDEALDVHLDVFAKIALDITFVLDHLADAVYLFFVQVLDLFEGVYVCLLQDFERARIADAIDVCERDPCLLVAGQIDASNTCHSESFCCFG